MDLCDLWYSLYTFERIHGNCGEFVRIMFEPCRAGDVLIRKFQELCCKLCLWKCIEMIVLMMSFQVADLKEDYNMKHDIFLLLCGILHQIIMYQFKPHQKKWLVNLIYLGKIEICWIIVSIICTYSVFKLSILLLPLFHKHFQGLPIPRKFLLSSWLIMVDDATAA